MKIILVSGVRHKTYINYISKYTPVNAKVNLTVDSLEDYLSNYGSEADIVLITDGGLSVSGDNNVGIIQRLAGDSINIAVLTHERYLQNELSGLKNVNVIHTDFLRATEDDISAALKFAPEKEKENKRKVFNIGASKPKPEPENDGLSDMGGAYGRAVAFTGRPGAGATSSAINVAYAAAKKGLRVILLDLDTEYRAANLYINKFCVMAEESEDIARSLVKTLASPQNYTETAVPVTDNLWVASLGYDFGDGQAIDKFFTEQKIAAAISALKNKFDYVFADIPLRALARVAGAMTHFDVFALCAENNLYAAVTTLQTLKNAFGPDDIRYLNIKSKLTATKYNDESMYDDEILTPEKLAALMTGGICADFTEELQIAGEVPYTPDFDRQIEADIPVYETNALLAQSYDKILTRL